MKNLLKKLFPVGAAVWIAVSAFPFGSIAAEKEDTDRFVEGTTINGVEVSGMTADEAKAHIEAYFKGTYTLKVRDLDGTQELIRDTDIGYYLQVTGDLNAVLQRENDGGRKTGPGEANSFRVEANSGCDEGLLRQAMENLTFVKNATPTTDAHISAYEEGKAFTIIPEVQGTEIDVDKLMAAAREALSEQRSVLRLADIDCRKTIQVTSLDDSLNRLCASLNQFKDVNITYEFGEKQEVLRGTEIAQWIKGTSGSEILVDEAKVAEYVKFLADTYDTYGKPILFHASSGREVTVPGAYGWQINQAEEVKALLQAIQGCESQTREPVYSCTAISRNGYDFGTTYVEVDLSGQHLYFYENGTCILDTPFVSGNVSKGWTTPPGFFTLYYKQRDKVLRGKQKADGTYEYESPVSYWMPFNGGIGLHDASWRSKFGGQIYQTGGSHGCINLPPRAAATIYEHVYTGIPIICYN